MSQRSDADAGGEINEAVAVDIRDFGAVALGERDSTEQADGLEAGREVCGFCRHQPPGFRPGDLSDGARTAWLHAAPALCGRLPGGRKASGSACDIMNRRSSVYNQR